MNPGDLSAGRVSIRLTTGFWVRCTSRSNFAVTPVERHDAAVEVLHVEAGVGKRIDHGAECRRVGASGFEEVALEFFAFAQRHCPVLSQRFCMALLR